VSSITRWLQHTACCRLSLVAGRTAPFPSWLGKRCLARWCEELLGLVLSTSDWHTQVRSPVCDMWLPAWGFGSLQLVAQAIHRR
jgi:hypothetical protein